MKQKIVLAGGAGFLGHSLTNYLEKDYEVIVLTRNPKPSTRTVSYIQWDGKTVSDWVKALDGAWAIVNLTGKSVNCVYTEENRREIIESRVNSVNVLSKAIAQSTAPPEIFVQAASLAIYGNTNNHICDETAELAHGFSPYVCKQWEAAVEEILSSNIRKAVLRIGFVLGRDGGALGTFTRLTKLYLGGTVGSGKQYISWIHASDMNAMFRLAIEDPKISGIYNATSPNPVTNQKFMSELRQALNRPWSPPVPALAVQLGARFILNTEASLALEGRRCIPKRFMAQGFNFEFQELHSALNDLFVQRRDALCL